MSYPCSHPVKKAWGRVFALAIVTMVSGFSYVQAQPFSLICMPDPQYYTTSNHPSRFNLYNRQAFWIRDNKTLYNTQHVIWLGDLTNDNTLTQWRVAGDAYTILDNANIPYAVVPGNHDYKTPTGWAGAHYRNLSFYNGIVGPARFAGRTWYGGNMGETTNQNENNYTYFSSNGLDFLVIGLEYAPRKEVITWANHLISQHPNHRVILFTHSYLTTNGSYGGQAGSATGTVGASGAEIWDECASRHSNVFMVVCGHVTESVVNTKIGVNGNIVYEMLVDYQSEKPLGTGSNLGNGWLRIMRFDPANNRINGSTVTPAQGDSAIFTNGLSQFYHTTYASSPAAADHLFSLNYNMTAPLEPYSYLNGSVKFHTTSVNNDLRSDQLDPDIGQAANGNWASVWEDDNDDNGIYNILVRGFDPDGNVRFDKSTVNATGINTVNAVNPSMAMMDDGRFVVTWQSGTTGIKMRTYNANGTPSGLEQTVISVTAPGSVNNPDVAIDNAGNFVVTWGDDSDGNGSFEIRARGFAFNNTQRFAAKLVNTVSAGQQQNPVIAMAGNGNYVIVWEDDRGGTWDLGMRGFLANETELFAQTLANATTVGEQIGPDVAMDDNGRFVVIWEDDADLNKSYQILARGFGAMGTQLFSERTVNVVATANQLDPSIAMDSFGNWYPVWEDNGAGGQGFQILSNAFTISGTRINAADVRVNPVTSVTNNFGTPDRRNPVVSAHKSGRYIVSWADDMDGDGAYQTLARGMAGTARSLVTKAINGSVSKSPEDSFYAPNAQVVLTATPNPGYAFLGWSGDVPGGSATLNPLTITMNGNKNLTARFVATSSVGDWPLY